jgi:hypothetical protein
VRAAAILGVIFLVACSRDGLLGPSDAATIDARPDTTVATIDAGPDTAVVDAPPCGDPTVMARFPGCASSTDEASCVAAGGSWQRSGLAPNPSCLCPTGQDGCPCTSQTECLSACIANIPGGAPIANSCANVTVGACAPVSPQLGCWCWFLDQGGGPMPVCAD